MIAEANAIAAAGRAHPPTEYSGIVTRAVAFVIDAAIVNAVALLVTAAIGLGLSVLPGTQKLSVLEVTLAGIAFVVWCVTYATAFWSTTGQTPGDRVMSIRVTRPDGGRVRAERALLRVGATALAALPLLAGFVPILLNERRRGLHDWLADTVVTRVPPAPSVDAGVRSSRPGGAAIP